ncbi:MAG TPA: glycosyltransferase family 39 protein [Dehalococcoidia bacterium]|nr:glycosyltransferase family 39 protein [Dehalococcoidia bacterium]
MEEVASEVKAGPTGAETGGGAVGSRAMLSERATVAGIALLAFAVRLAFIAYARFVPTLNDDAGRYDLLGRSLAQAAGYVNPNGTTTLFWPPGYPFILAAVYRLSGDSVRAALVVNALLASGTVVLVYLIGRRAFDARTGLIAAALYALLPSAVFFADVTLSETAFTFVLLLGVWLIIEASLRRSAWLLVLAGVVVGYAALIRGQAALIPVVAVPFWAWIDGRSSDEVAGRKSRVAGRGWRESIAGRTAAPFVVVGIAAAAVVAPWTIRNFVESGSPVVISTNAGVDFYIGHSAGADGHGRIVNELVFRYPNLSEPRAEAKISNDGFREGLSYAAHHPAREVTLAVRKVGILYYSDHEALRWVDGHAERHVFDVGMFHALSRLSDVYYWGLLVLALAGIVRWLSFPHGAAGGVRLLLVSIVVYWTLVHVAFFADPRFHAPIMPVVCLWAAVGVGVIADVVIHRWPQMGTDG